MKKIILVLLLVFILIVGGLYTYRLFLGGPGTSRPMGNVFCGISTRKECSVDNDCKVGGCSNQICGGVNEELISTCEYKDCYNYEFYDYKCKCVDGKCLWF